MAADSSAASPRSLTVTNRKYLKISAEAMSSRNFPCLFAVSSGLGATAPWGSRAGCTLGSGTGSGTGSGRGGGLANGVLYFRVHLKTHRAPLTQSAHETKPDAQASCSLMGPEMICWTRSSDTRALKLDEALLPTTVYRIRMCVPDASAAEMP